MAKPGSAPVRSLSFTVTLACSLTVACFSVTPAFAADEIHWTVVGPTSITFDWRGSETSLRYGPTASYGQTAAAVAPNPLPFSSSGPFQEARLTGLAVGALYHYSIGSGADHTFRTPPQPGTSGFTICAEAEIGRAHV